MLGKITTVYIVRSVVRRKKINYYVHQRLKVWHNSDYILSISL